MQRPDHSSALAFAAFTLAATVWIGMMAVQPKPEGLQASVIVLTKDIAMVRPQPHLVELADLSR